MFLVELTTIADAALPLAAFRDHLRLGSGFGTDDLQDDLLTRHLRAAIATIEAQTGKVLYRRSFSWTLAAWRDLAQQVLPVAPVVSLTGLEIHDQNGGVEVIDAARYRLVSDAHRPRLATTGYCLPPIPVGGKAVIEFTGGMAANWEGFPTDIAQAVLMLAATLYEDRTGDDRAGLPAAVEALVHRYRNVRLFGGMRG